MRDIRNLNIWKQEPNQKEIKEAYMNSDITELNLSVRSYNCLKRAGCHTIRDILNCMGEDGKGLRRLRNLGSRSEEEILEKIEELEVFYEKINPSGNGIKKKVLLKPAKRIWDKDIDEFHLSGDALRSFSSCGIRQIRDLYENRMNQDPGWFAVRELFEKIPVAR